jgi:flagellar hook-associated protein 1
MSSLFAAMGTASNALMALEQAMGVVQNNVANASTPGYVTQTLSLNSSAFNPSQGLAGGVRAGSMQNARNTFAEQNVWSANQQLGASTQEAANLQAIQSTFDVSGTSGIPKALSTLYSAFSAWSATPSSGSAQQQVLSAAQGISQAFQSAASNIQGVRAQAVQQTQSTVDQINQLTTQIADINSQIRRGNHGDAGLDANMYNNLEQLSNLVNFSARTESDGTVTVLMDGQVPLVIGTNQNDLKVVSSNSSSAPGNATPPQQILTSTGDDVTSHVEGGQLNGLLSTTNSVIPALLGDNSQQGSLNQLAQSIADRVNGLLTSGQTASGAPGVPLFTYNASSPTSVASTLSVNPSITPGQLAAADPGPPSSANGIATQLSQLQSPTSAASTVGGVSYIDFYSSIAANVGSQQGNAAKNQQAQSQVLAQAQSARSQVSGISLNQQAAQLLQFQDAYQASAQAISTINSTIQSLMQAFR